MPAGRHASSRRRTREKGSFVRETPGSRSPERGLSIIRAFRPGHPLLTNAEIAERTDLSRPTVSRLTRLPVDAGFLEYGVAAADDLRRELESRHAPLLRRTRDRLPQALGAGTTTTGGHGAPAGNRLTSP